MRAAMLALALAGACLSGCETFTVAIYNATDSPVGLTVMSSQNQTIVSTPDFPAKSPLIFRKGQEDFGSVDISIPNGTRFHYTRPQLDDMAAKVGRKNLPGQWNITQDGLIALPSR